MVQIIVIYKTVKDYFEIDEHTTLVASFGTGHPYIRVLQNITWYEVGLYGQLGIILCNV